MKVKLLNSQPHLCQRLSVLAPLIVRIPLGGIRHRIVELVTLYSHLVALGVSGADDGVGDFRIG